MIYIKGLEHSNFKDYIEVVKESIREIIRFEEVSIPELSVLIGISKQTLYRHFYYNKTMSFHSINRLNNFLKRYKEKQDEILNNNKNNSSN